MNGADRLAAAARERSENVTASRGVQRFVEQLPAAAAGAGSGALFGLPEYIAKQIDREGFEDWERQNEGFRVGEVAGTIGSAFVPLGGLAGKGLQALGKAAGAGRVGQALTGAGRVLTGASKAKSLGGAIGQGAIRGATEGVLDASLRAGFGERDILPEALGAGAIGGAIGGLGGGLGRGIEMFDEARKAGRQSYIGQLTGGDSREIRKTLQKYTGGGSPAEKLRRADQTLDEIARFGQRNPELLSSAGRDENLVRLLDQTKKQLNPVFETASRAGRDIKGEALQQILGNIDDIAITAGTNTTQATRSVKKLVDQVSTADLGRSRNLLSDVINKTSQSDVPDAIVRNRAAIEMRRAIDDRLQAVAETMGSDFSQALKDYKAIQTLSGSELKNLSKVTGTGTGSATAEKSALQRMMGVGAGGGGVVAAGTAMGEDWSDPEKIAGNLAKVAGAGALGSIIAGASGALSRAPGREMYKILDAALQDPNLAKKIASVATRLSEPVIRAGGRAGSTLLAADRAGKAVDAREERVQQMELGLEDPTRQEGRQEARELGQEAKAEQQGQPSDYMTMVEQKLYQRFASLYPDYAQDEEAFSQFMEGARKASSDFDPKRTAKLLFPREEDRKAYLAALSARQSVDKSLPGVGEKDAGLFGLGLGATPLNEQQLGARATLEGAFLEAAKLANVDAKNARTVLQSIVDSKDSLTKKREKILAQVRAWNEQGFDALTRAGLGG